ncbi:MAG: ABC transporter substrate-binding protein [Gallionellaceae bacterium]
MDLSRRNLLKAISVLPLIAAYGRAAAGDVTTLRINIPGPLSLPFLPIELIPILGIDRNLNAQLNIRYFPSGVRALEDMLAGNAQFSAQGFTVLPAFQAKGKHVKTIAPLSGQVPPYGIVVRSDLRGKIRRAADLKGHSIGISVGSVTSKTYMQQVAESFLSASGVQPNEVRWVPTAQSWDGQFGALNSKSVDAVYCEEPFMSGLVRKKTGFLLSDFSDPKVRAVIPGAGHFRATITTTAENIAQDAHAAELMVQMLRQSLSWIFNASANEIVSRLGIKDEGERQDMLHVLSKNREMYASDVRFSQKQMIATEQFMVSTGISQSGFDIHSLIANQFAGEKP